MEISDSLYVKNRMEWRKWLEKNHDKIKIIWMIFYKKHTGIPCISYSDAVEEALCFGWIDSIIKRVDDEKYIQKFTPRSNKNKWSDLNIKRMKKMIEAGLMTKAGLEKFDESFLDKKKIQAEKKEVDITMPEAMMEELKFNAAARENYNKLAPSHKKLYLRWITSAKKEETILKRIKEAIGLLEKGKKLGLK
jgi:uncharacterized protein YdeI (YjbR/CyaY-like superfamily)